MSLMSLRSTCGLAVLLAGSLALGACGPDEVKYVPRPAYSGSKANLPPVANVPKKPIKNGEAYTIWGVSYYLRSPVHRKEVQGKKLSLTGYIVKTNLGDAPACAVHKGGKADPENCKPPIPAFWLGDTKDAPEAETIKVMGWASNFAQVFDAITEFDKGTPNDKDKGEHVDTFWQVKIPNPLPAPGAKVTVKGDYSTTFTKSSTGAEADPFMGMLSYEEMTVAEPSSSVSTLPGVKRKEKK